MSEYARLFLQLTGPSGPIKGESRALGRLDWIEIDDWDWQLEPKDDGDDSAAVVPSVFSFSKTMDRATTAMLTAMREGYALTATLKMEDTSTLQRADNTLQMFDLSMEFKRVRFIQYQLKTEISDKRESVQEDWEFDYESLSFTYRPDLQSGVMKLEIERSPGSSTHSPQDKLKQFTELSKDMSVQELDELWKKILEAKRKEAQTNKTDAKSKDRE